MFILSKEKNDYVYYTNHIAMNSNSRFYRKKYPEVDTYVMARITKVDDIGATCVLLEYDNMPAFMPISQFSRRWIRSIRQVAKAGNEEILQVLGVNESTGSVDLSKKMLTKDDIDKGNTHYQMSRKYHNLMRRVADVCESQVLDLYESFGWNLYEQHGNVHPLQILEQSLNDGSVLDRYQIPKEYFDSFIDTVKKRVQLQQVKYETEISVSCYSPNGTDTLIEIFENFEKATGVVPTIKSSPSYILSMTSTDEKDAIHQLNILNATLENICQTRQVAFGVVTEPTRCEEN